MLRNDTIHWFARHTLHWISICWNLVTSLMQSPSARFDETLTPYAII
jgi:hypothetical protein